MEVIITLGKDLQDDYESWLAVKESLGIERSINNFLHYIHYYGTYANPIVREDEDENT